ncbi:MAG: hypothetical protein ABEI80_07020 [Haloplanus sp.]
MTLQDTSAGRGIDGIGVRVFALVAALLVTIAAWNVALNTVLARTGLATAVETTYAATLPLSTVEAAVVVAAASVAVIVVLAALVRAFAPDTDALGGSETATATVLAYARAVVVAVVGTLAAAVGLAAIVVPGLLVIVHLPLVFVAVAADGESIRRAVDRAWTRARGNRARVVALLLAVGAVPLAVAVIATLTTLLSPPVELAVGVVVTTGAAAAGAAAFTAITASLDGDSGQSRTDRVAPATSRQL